MKRKREPDEYGRILERLRASARSEERDWRDDDWHRALLRATAVEPGEGRPGARPRPAWVWAYAAAVLILLGGAAVAVRTFFRAAVPTVPARLEPAAGESAGPGLQEQLSMTLVSADSGLRVYWYFDKEFDWKEEIP